MARCGCDSACSCTLGNGTCTTFSGDGSSVRPFKVNITVDGDTVTCGGSGLQATLHKTDTNTVTLSGLGTTGSPLEAHVIRTPDANVPDPDSLGTGNLIKEIAGPSGGIYVSCEDVQDCVGSAINKINVSDCLVYDDTTNTIQLFVCAEPNGIECAPAGDPDCPAGGLLVFPSSDADNTLTFGADNRLFAAAAAIVPGPCMTFTGAGTQASPFVITPQIAPEPNGVECVPGFGLLVTPSSDAGNRLTYGADQRLYVEGCPFVNAGSQVLVGNTGPCFELVGGADCVTPMVATLRISDDICNGLICGNDGLYVRVDDTPLPTTVQTTFNFGPFGPFAGNNPFPGTQVVAPVCITITNPSPCRDMITSGLLSGFAEVGRTSGEFRVFFDISTVGNLGGPWFTVSQVGTGAPEPANRYTGNALWGGDEFVIGPGASRSICTRVMIFSTNAVNARVFSGQATLSLVGKWAE